MVWSLRAGRTLFSASSGTGVISCGARASPSRRVGSNQGRVGEGRKRSAGLGTRRLLARSLVGTEERDRRRG